MNHLINPLEMEKACMWEAATGNTAQYQDNNGPAEG